MYGAFIRQVRQSRGLSQRELAEVSGISQPNISAMENDHRLPSVDTLSRLLVACGYELAAVAAGQVIYGPFPRGGWFPDEDLPAALADDPPDEDSTVGPATSAADRARILTAVLEVSDWR